MIGPHSRLRIYSHFQSSDDACACNVGADPTFADASSTVTGIQHSTTDVQLADLDNDGDLDVIWVSQSGPDKTTPTVAPGGIDVWYNQSDGTFDPQVVFSQSGYDPNDPNDTTWRDNSAYSFWWSSRVEMIGVMQTIGVFGCPARIAASMAEYAAGPWRRYDLPRSNTKQEASISASRLTTSRSPRPLPEKPRFT